MKNIISTLILALVTCLAMAQTSNIFRLGLFVGEGSGILGEFQHDKFGVELNLGYNELLYKYNYMDKYENGFKYFNHKGTYSTSFLFKFDNSFRKNGKFHYVLSAGTQGRIIANANYQFKNNNIPDVSVNDDPVSKNIWNMGICAYAGLKYETEKRLSVFADMGAYTEIVGKKWWTIPMFRIGASVSLNKN